MFSTPCANAMCVNSTLDFVYAFEIDLALIPCVFWLFVWNISQQIRLRFLIFIDCFIITSVCLCDFFLQFFSIFFFTKHLISGKKDDYISYQIDQ